jgi:hypothetical protein
MYPMGNLRFRRTLCMGRFESAASWQLELSTNKNTAGTRAGRFCVWKPTLVASGLLQCNTLGVEGLRRKPVSVRDLRFQVAVRASGDGRFTFQIFTLSGEPRTFHAGSQTYATPADAAQAGREAIAANCQ